VHEAGASIWFVAYVSWPRWSTWISRRFFMALHHNSWKLSPRVIRELTVADQQGGNLRTRGALSLEVALRQGHQGRATVESSPSKMSAERSEQGAE
jgi:hypothetical protein